MLYFDYETIACQAGIPADKFARLVKSHAEEEPNDPMLAELHTRRVRFSFNGSLSAIS